MNSPHRRDRNPRRRAAPLAILEFQCRATPLWRRCGHWTWPVCSACLAKRVLDATIPATAGPGFLHRAGSDRPVGGNAARAADSRSHFSANSGQRALNTSNAATISAMVPKRAPPNTRLTGRAGSATLNAQLLSAGPFRCRRGFGRLSLPLSRYQLNLNCHAVGPLH